MSVELKVPQVGESISDVAIGPWLKGEGERVERGEILVEIETDKVTMELPAPVSGVISKLLKKEGEPAKVGEVIGYMEESAAGSSTAPAKPAPEAKSDAAKTDKQPKPAREPAPAAAPERKAPKPAAEPKPEARPAAEAKPAADAKPAAGGARIMPAARRALAEQGLRPDEVTPTGPGGRVLKEDVSRYAEEQSNRKRTEPRPAPTVTYAGDREEEVVPMSPIRRRIAQRLVEAQQGAALLTTFNEIDMAPVMALRKEYGDAFLEKYKVKLGFMSFFVKATIDALKLIPQVNAEIRGTDIVYHNYYDIGIAIGSGKGLVVPILRNAERMSFGEIELAIADLANRAKENKLKLEELEGGTFTISNGGIYGSMLSTPIVNPPQSGILGLHAIQDRPVVRDGQIVIRPMMYVALTYDHRIIDGREAVTFLKRIKDVIEKPARMLMEI